MTETTNLRLKKPDSTDFYNVGDFNDNADIIDAAMSGKAEKSEIPTSLPANGGNADTVDGKHAADFAEANHTHDDRYYTEAEADAQFAAKTDIPTSLPANGGNADTVDGKHAAAFFPKSDLSHSFALGTNPSANESRLMAFCDSTGSVSKSLGWLAHTQYADGKSAIGLVVKNNASSSQTLFGITVQISEDGGTFYANTLRPSSPSLSALRNLASGTDEATTSNCPNGCWYGQHE